MEVLAKGLVVLKIIELAKRNLNSQEINNKIKESHRKNKALRNVP